MIKRIFLSCLILFSTVSSALLLESPPVYAASDYGISQTDTLIIGGDQCPAKSQNIANSWGSILSSNGGVPLSYKNTWNYVNNYESSRQQLDSFSELFSDRLAEGSGWAVSYNTYGTFGSRPSVTIYVSESSNSNFTVTQNSIDSSSNMQYRSFAYNPAGDCRWQALRYSGSTGSIYVDADNPIFLLASDNVSYPVDYIGPEIRKSFTPKPDFYVPYILNIDDKKLTITPKPIDTGGKCWKWASTLVKKGSSTSENFADWEVVAETDYLSSNEPAELKVSEYGNDYAIGMLAYNCDAPAAPISDSYNLKLERIFPLKVDGSSYILDSDDMGCEAGGICEPPSPFEDCATYGADLIGGIGCQIRNFGVLLRSLFITLFVPSPGFFKDYFTEFKDFINAKLGFLIWPVTWSVDFVSAFFNGVNGTNNICNWSFGNIFNNDFKLNFCSLEQHFPTAFNTARYMIQAFTVFMLVSGLYGHYRRILRT